MDDGIGAAEGQEIEQIKRKLMNSVLDKDAYERLGRVRSVNPNIAAQAELYLMQAFQAGKLKGKVSDSELKGLLRALSSKKGFNIKRK